MALCSAMIYQRVTLSGDDEWPKVADAMIEACSRPRGGSVPGRACPCPQCVCRADVVRFARCTAQQVPLGEALAWPSLLVPGAAVLGRSAAQWPHPAPALPRQPKEGTGAAALCPCGCILLRRCQADAAWAWAGVQRGGSVPPHPSPVAALRCRSNGLLLPGCVLPGTGGGRVLLPLTASHGSGDHGGGRPLAAAGGCRLLRRFFFLLKTRNVILAGPRPGQASRPSVRPRTLDMASSTRIGAAQEGGRKRKMPQQPAAFAARGRTACFTPRRHGKIWRSGGSTGTRRCTAAAHSPKKNPLEEDLCFFTPEATPKATPKGVQERSRP